ncbi:lysine--tRNA ligase [Candidatus Woesearchaeota archaeon]|nr:lysine--tRNA ligase [Candidatus Woesearchaeota archaeon]
MPNEAELVAERKRKLAELKGLGINPYPYKYEISANSNELKEKYESLPHGGKTQDKTSVAGRITGFRRLGKIVFADILDSYGKMQLYFKADSLGQRYELLKLFDAGDWIGASGDVFRTQAGELSIDVQDFSMLCKSLRPLPEKWHGLKDVEARYRQRYVDLIINQETKQVFRQRALLIDKVRSVLKEKGYLEVETPVLEATYGGAAARPFKSFLHSLKMDIYLRISLELPLKKLIVGGFDRVFEISKVFRNEDIDRSHNPEFTMLEAYCAYADFEDMMDLTEDIYIACAKQLHGSTKVRYQDVEIDFKKPWLRMTMVEALKKYGNVDVGAMKTEELLAKIKNEKASTNASRGELIELLFKEIVEQHLIQPVFITHHPKESTPLCKLCRKNPEFSVERFEPFVMGMEIGNAYSELNDPILQRQLLEEQEIQLRKGNQEANPIDEDFLRAIEHGMPPTGGLGLGIDRLTMLMTNNPSIRDIIFFPFMKQ